MTLDWYPTLPGWRRTDWGSALTLPPKNTLSCVKSPIMLGKAISHFMKKCKYAFYKNKFIFLKSVHKIFFLKMRVTPFLSLAIESGENLNFLPFA